MSSGGSRMGAKRTFATGANRNSDEGKYDYEGFLSPIVLQRYLESQVRWKETCWAAGLFEGEGWIGHYKTRGQIRKDGTPSSPEGYKYPRLGMSLTDLDTLERFQRYVGGKITGPYLHEKRKPIWSWRITGQSEAFGAAFLLYPYLGTRRKEKMREVFGASVARGEERSLLEPNVLEAFGRYMHKHRLLEDGTLRPSDNWQLGIPKDAYMSSAWRHFLDWHLEHRGYKSREGLEDALCALLFNVQGYLFEVLKEHEIPEKTEDRGA